MPEEEAIDPAKQEWGQAIRGIFYVTKPKPLHHKKYWDMEKYRDSVTDILATHTILDSTLRLATYTRIKAREIIWPLIAAEVPESVEDTVQGNLRGKFGTGPTAMVKRIFPWPSDKQLRAYSALENTMHVAKNRWPLYRWPRSLLIKVPFHGLV
jgi:hypothetical protein